MLHQYRFRSLLRLGSAALLTAFGLEGTVRAQTWTNLVSNSTFASGSTSPWVLQSNAAGASFESASVSSDAYTTLDVTVSDAALGVTDLQVGQAGLNIVAGRTYRVTFYGMADATLDFAQARVKVGEVLSPYTPYFQEDVSIPYVGPSGYGQTFQYTFTANASDANAWFGVFVGGNNGSLELDSMYLEEASDVSGTGGATGAGGNVGSGGIGGAGGNPGQGTATAVHVNQLGYLPSGEKHVTVVSSATAPLAWQLLDSNGTVVQSGTTKVFGNDAASGDAVHIADFTTYATPGDGYHLEVGGVTSPPFDIHPDVFASLRRNALRFFYHQRASSAIVAPYAEGSQWERAEGHPDMSITCLSGCTYSLDVSKGWYDAGDHGKYVVNGGIALFTLLDLYERTKTLGTTVDELGDGTSNIPESSNGKPDLLDEAEWEMSFMLGMQVPAGAPLAGMAHHKVHDDDWTPLPTLPADDTMPRHLHPPSTAATLNLAATAAQAARVFAGVDDAFSAKCLAAAETAFAAAQANPSTYAPATDDVGGGAYDDNDATDEFYWAAAELYVTTGSKTYEDVVRGSPHLGEIGAGQTPFAWQSVAGLGTVSLAVQARAVAPDLLVTARSAIVSAADRYVKTVAASGYGSPVSTYAWGSDSDVLNIGIVLGLAYDITGDARYSTSALATFDHVLGRNALGQSYVTDIGPSPFQNSHHRFWAHGIDPTWPVPPPGVIAGGPNSNLDGLLPSDPLEGCRGPKCWRDDAQAYSLCEVAINWNAPLVWVAAWANEFGSKPQSVHPGIDGKGTGVVTSSADGGSTPARDASAAGAGGNSGSAGNRDGGIDNGGSAEGDGAPPDASHHAGATSSSGCGCREASGRTSGAGFGAALTALLISARRRSRRSRIRDVSSC